MKHFLAKNLKSIIENNKISINTNSIAYSARIKLFSHTKAIQIWGKNLESTVRIKYTNSQLSVSWVIECQYVNGENYRLSGGARVPAVL